MAPSRCCLPPKNDGDRDLVAGPAGLDSHAHVPALALLLPGLALGALLPQLAELLRIVEQTGDALLAHPDVLALALPSQGRREVPVVLFKHFAYPRER